MDCVYCRELLSARLDGEPPTPEEERAGITQAIDAHVLTCAGCQAFAEEARVLHRNARIRAAEPVANLTRAIVASAPAFRRRRLGSFTAAQIALGCVGLVLLVIALPTMLLHTGGGMAIHHTTRELAAFQAALGLGFLVVAWEPQRAAGVLPMAATLVGAMCMIALVDVGRGQVPSLAEAQHLFELAGLVLVWRVERTERADGSAPDDRHSLGLA
jgi:predicted anti-sigma-YlaC factor YlaD